METPTHAAQPVDLDRLVRPFWMTGCDVNDWPEDSTHENGNYFNKCVACDTDFIGLKRRWVCKKCRMEDDARWEALSEDEKKAEMEKMSADFEAWLHSGTNAEL
jgi:hypothetical protein